jgi:hypothetical protein
LDLPIDKKSKGPEGAQSGNSIYRINDWVLFNQKYKKRKDQRETYRLKENKGRYNQSLCMVLIYNPSQIK